MPGWLALPFPFGAAPSDTPHCLSARVYPRADCVSSGGGAVPQGIDAGLGSLDRVIDSGGDEAEGINAADRLIEQVEAGVGAVTRRVRGANPAPEAVEEGGGPVAECVLPGGR